MCDVLKGQPEIATMSIDGECVDVHGWRYYAFACLLSAGMFGWYYACVVGLDLTGGLGVTLDDGWIHLVFARNVAGGGGWCFNAGEPSGGDSSILWVVLLAFGFLFSDDGVTIGHICNGGALLVLGWLVCRVASELVGRSYRRWWMVALIVAVVLCNGNLIWYAFTGMEPLLLLVVGLAAICSAAAGRVYAVLVMSFLAALVRPEGITVGLAIWIWHWLGTGGAGRIDDSRRFSVHHGGLIGAVLGLTAGCLWNYHLCGQLLPSTVIGRSWIIGYPPGMEWNPLAVAERFGWIAAVWCYRLLQFTFGQVLLTRLGLPVWLGWAVAVGGGLVCIVGLGVYLCRMRARSAVLLIWAVLQVLTFAVTLPSRGHGGRYQPMVLILVMLCFGLGVVGLLRLVFASGRCSAIRRIAAGGVVVLVVVVVGSAWLWREITAESILHFDRVHVSAGRWLGRHTSSDARVAAFDIGAIGYFSGRAVVDIGGLLDSRAGRALYDDTMVEYIRSQKAEYLAMIFPYTDPQAYVRGLGLDELEEEGRLCLQETFTVDVPSWYLPGEAARLLANTIRVYRIEW